MAYDFNLPIWILFNFSLTGRLLVYELLQKAYPAHFQLLAYSILALRHDDILYFILALADIFIEYKSELLILSSLEYLNYFILIILYPFVPEPEFFFGLFISIELFLSSYNKRTIGWIIIWISHIYPMSEQDQIYLRSLGLLISF